MADNEQGTGSPAPEEDPGRPASATEKDAATPEPAKELVPEAKEVKRQHPSYVFLAVVTILNLAADLVSKQWTKDFFEGQRPGGERKIVLIEDHMSLIFAKNRGGAWGLLQNEAEGLRRPFFLIVSVAAIVFIVSLYRKLTPGQRALKWGLPLVLGGALGNLIDRIRYGYVVDFIDVYMKMDGQVKHWPTFNVADIAICVGVGLMAIDMFSPRKDKAKTAVVEEVKATSSNEPPAGEAAPDKEPPSDLPKSEGDQEQAAARGS
jgi:signal peptidase II